MTLTRARVRVEGIVQGVGFRPFVHALAGRLGLAGLVGNDAGGVFVEVEGAAETVERFLAALAAEAPPLVEPLHARAVDGEDVDREPVQVAERGVAGAEVVDGQPRPQALELAQDRQDGLAVDHTVADQVPFTVTGPSCDSSDTTFFGVYLPATLDAGDRLYVGSAGAYTTPPTATGSRRRLRCSSAADDPAAPPDRDGAGRLVRAVARLDGVQPPGRPRPRPGRA